MAIEREILARIMHEITGKLYVEHGGCGGRVPHKTGVCDRCKTQL